MQVINIEELKKRIPEDEFENIKQIIEEEVRSNYIAFSEEDYQKDLEQLAKEREEKVQQLLSQLQIKVDYNLFAQKLLIDIPDIKFKTYANQKPIEERPKIQQEQKEKTDKDTEIEIE